MRRYLCIVVGRWKLENWHLYVEREHCSVKKPSNRWKMWDRIL